MSAENIRKIVAYIEEHIQCDECPFESICDTDKCKEMWEKVFANKKKIAITMIEQEGYYEIDSKTERDYR